MTRGFQPDASASAHIADLTEDMLDEVAADVEGYAFRLAAVKSGRMRGALRTDSYPGRREIGSAVDYSEFVEQGTQNMPAQPFLRPALYRHR